jgi:hypothetical protein
MKITIKIHRNERSTPPGKLADAELHFTGGELDGLKLIGFGVWERRIPNREVERDGHSMYHLNVTFPARTFTVHGEKRNFALVRAIDNSWCWRRTSARSAKVTTLRVRSGPRDQPGVASCGARHLSQFKEVCDVRPDDD